MLEEAQAAAVAAAQVGSPASSVDATAREVLAAGGYGGRCIHRVGHGIGVEAHEAPYLVDGNDEPLAAGEAFSVEPGIYLPGEWGLRLEDIVVATDDGPRPLNRRRPRPRHGPARLIGARRGSFSAGGRAAQRGWGRSRVGA